MFKTNSKMLYTCNWLTFEQFWWYTALPAWWFLVWPKIYDSFDDIIIIWCSIHLDFQLVECSINFFCSHPWTQWYSFCALKFTGQISTGNWRNFNFKFNSHGIFLDYDIIWGESKSLFANSYTTMLWNRIKNHAFLWNGCHNNTNIQRNLLLLDIACNSFVCWYKMGISTQTRVKHENACYDLNYKIII